MKKKLILRILILTLRLYNHNYRIKMFNLEEKLSDIMYHAYQVLVIDVTVMHMR